MSQTTLSPNAGATRAVAQTTTYFIIFSVASGHLLNDMLQALIPSLYPLFKTSYGLDYSQIGLITLIFQVTASLLQPLVGMVADNRPRPFSLPIGMVLTFAGLILLSQAHSYSIVLLAAGLVGIGSSIFHPEASRVARMASGGKHGMAQSFFQVGGNFGQALGPLLAAYGVATQRDVIFLSGFAILGIGILTNVGFWYRREVAAGAGRRRGAGVDNGLSQRTVVIAMTVLVALVLSKQLYMSSLTNYYTFYLMETFGVSTRNAQLYLFLFGAASALGIVFGGPLADRIGRKKVIWGSILGALPFALALPFANLFWTAILSVLIGLIISSAFSAMVVMAQELMPGRVGLVAGLFFGLAFGFSGLGAAALGWVADQTSISFVYSICSILPLTGLLAIFLPNLERKRAG